MDRRIVDRVESWESRPIEGGFAGLQSLVDDDFSGAVSAAGAWLFLLNGRGVGVIDGDLDAFAGKSATAHEAPDAALPLLFAMQETGGETYATYYTNDTPLSEVDDTLTEANFTGYIELSENVLSGDYYVVYYGGRSMSAAFIGSSERLISGDEAYEKAADEVGIYEVTKVDLDLVDIPEPTATGDQAGGAAASAFDEPALDADDGEESSSSGVDALGGDPIEEAETVSADAGDQDTATAGSGSDSTEAGAGDESTVDLESGGLADTIEAAESAGSDPAAGTDRAEPDPEPMAEDTEPTDETPATEPDSDQSRPDGATTTEAETAAHPEPDPDPQPTPSPDTEGSTSPSETGSSGKSRPTQEEPRSPESGDDPFSEEEQWRETRTIPALNPEESEGAANQPATEPEPSPQPQGRDTAAPPANEQSQSTQRSEPRQPEPSQPAAEPSGEAQPAGNDQLQRLQEALEEREAELETLRGRHEEATAEIESLREERDDLRERIEELEQAVEGADSGGAEAGPSQSLDRQTALEQTDLFVRYGSKGEGTLEKAHGGQTTREDVAGNLRLEHHTRFEEDDVAVDGRPFVAFLQDTIEYRFVEWLVEDLLWEIQGTGSRGKLKDLYDALPAIDRAEFGGTITTRDDEGEEHSREFDVIVRDRMGQPLVVANINDRRDPATGGMMESLVEASTDVAEELDTLGAAFQVTASFFKPDALETASGATGSGLLSRDKRQSFVKLSRKRGYHLCLVESRGDDFHVTVPEL